MKQIVDVILPVFNGASSIERCVRSVMNQNLLNNLIVVNDGSVDNTKDILLGLGNEFVNLIIIDLPTNVGLVLALNECLRYVSAPFVARIDADDEMLPNRLFFQYEFLKLSNADLVGSKLIGLRSGKEYKIYAGVSKQVSKLDLMFSSCLFHPTWFGRKEVFNLGYNTIMPVEDLDFQFRAINSGFVLRNLATPLTLYCEDDPNKISNINKSSHVILVLIIRFSYLFFNKNLFSDLMLLKIKKVLNRFKFFLFFSSLLEYFRIFLLKILFKSW